MTVAFRYRASLETAYRRKARLIVEVMDPVTLEPLRDGLTVRASGLIAEPVVTSSGRFVWFEEDGATPSEVSIEPGQLPYSPRVVAVPPLPPPPPPPAKPQTWTDMRLELGPSTAYAFAAGATALRGTIIRNGNEDPVVPLANLDVRLRWIDDNAPGEQWRDAPTVSCTSATGDFAAIVRLAPSQIARVDAQGRMRVRLAASRVGQTRLSPELTVAVGKVTDSQQSFAWDDLQP